MKKTIQFIFALALPCLTQFTLQAQTSDNTLTDQFTEQTSINLDWDWAKSGNGTGTEWCQSVSVDRWGNSYLFGFYNSPTINFSGTILTNASSSDDIFLAKYDLYGNLLWAKTFGGTGSDQGNEVITDSLGNVFIGGSFYSATINFGSFTLTNSAANNTADIFLVKLNSNGDVLWAKSAGGNARDVIIGMDVDSLGNGSIIGSYSSSNITFGSTVLTNTNTAEEVFIAKYDFNGNPLWAKSGNGNGIDWGNGIAIDGNGNCYATGSFAGTSINFSGNVLTNANTDGSSDIYVVKYNTSGDVVWAKKWGGSGEDVGLEIDVSRDGKCYFTGPYQSSSLVFESNTLTNSNTTTEDIYITKLNQVGNAVWAKSGNGSGSDTPSDIILDEFENVLLAGSFRGHTVFFGDSTLTNVSLSDTADIFIIKYNSSGNLISSSKAGGNKSDIGSSIAVHNSESFLLSGTFGSDNLTFGSTSLINAGSFDVFIAYSGNIVEEQKIFSYPPFHGVPATSGSVIFDVSNIGNGNMNWSAVSSDPSWLTIISGSTGTNSGQIQVSYQANSADYRVDSIIIDAPGAVNSTYIIEVRQSAFGSDWIVKTSGTTETLNDVKFIGDQLGWVVGNNGLILHTTDSGNTWVKQTSPKNVKLLKVFFINSVKGWAVGDSGTIIKTTNGGDLWELKNSNVTSTLTDLQFLDENLGWVTATEYPYTSGNTGKILKTTDSGISWNIVSTINDFAPRSIHFSDANNGVVGSFSIIGIGNYTLLQTNDGGLTWIGYYHQSWYYHNYFNFASDLETGLLVASDEHYNFLYRTIDGGQNWNKIALNDNYRDFFPQCFHVNSQRYSWMLSAGKTFALYSSDFGEIWGSQFIGNLTGGGNSFNSYKSITSYDSTLAWAVGNSGMIIRYQQTQYSKYLKLISPNGGEIFRKGETINITWTSNEIEQVRLILQDWYPNIAENIPANQGSYLWQIPLNAMGNKIVVRSQDFDQIYDFSDNYFKILPSCFTWLLEDSTGKSALISIPVSINSTIGDDTLELGDFIGVFFSRNDNLICGGYGIWHDEELIITAWGDNIATPIKDGFYEGEEMFFKVFKPNSCEEYFAKVTLQSGSPTYQTNGNYVLTSLKGINGVRLTIEGLYNYDSTTDWLRMKDTVRAYLRNSISPYGIVDSAISVIDTLGFVANFNFNNVTSGDYYLVIKHRNSIEIWSSEPITITEGDFNCYNFTDDSSKAYGNNMKKKGDKWCIYSGDIDRDGIVDLSDLILVDNDNENFVTGYVPSDVNGDNRSDLSDMIIVDNNNAKFVRKVVPTGVLPGKEMGVQNQEFNNDQK